MNKNIVKATFVVAIAIIAGYNVYTSQQKVEMSDLAMSNVEALANGESDCHNTNGYKDWDTESWFGNKKEFYDCCNVLRSGYSPSGNCQ